MTILYFLLCLYYFDRFIFGTWINGQYCTGMTVAEVNRMLYDEETIDRFVLESANGEKISISLAEIEYSIDFSSGLSTELTNQTPAFWIQAIGEQKPVELEPTIQFNRMRLNQLIEESDLYQKESGKERGVFITYIDAEGYILEDNMTQVMNLENIQTAAYQALKSGEDYLNLVDADCYDSFEMTSEMKETVALYAKVNDFQSCAIEYKFNQQNYPVQLADSAQWILLDEEKNFVLDEDGNLQVDAYQVEAYVSDLIYAHSGTNRTYLFTTTEGIDKTIVGGTFHSNIDLKSETEYLIQCFLNKTSEVREPMINEEIDNTDIGDTYIEIDLTNQKLYFYENKRLIIDTDIVSGGMYDHYATPEGVNYVYLKQMDQIIHGDNHSSFVSYWLPVVGEIGIHDASWRSEFGGDIYYTNGSQGNIQVPMEVMTKIYQNVELFTPVVMYY